MIPARAIVVAPSGKMSEGEIHAVAAADADSKENGEEAPKLTNKQAELITQTWELVKQDLEKAGMIMFMK